MSIAKCGMPAAEDNTGGAGMRVLSAVGVAGRRRSRKSGTWTGLGVTTLAAAVVLPLAVAAPASASVGVVNTITVGGNPQGVAVDSTTGTVFVANQGSNTVSVISEATGMVTHTIALGNAPTAIAVHPNTHWVFLTS